MSLKQIEAALTDFLQSPTPRIIALSGRWGLGKTYYWRRFLEQGGDGEWGRRQYSYLSLFGVQSIQAVKDSLFDNSRSLNSVRESTNSGDASSVSPESERVEVQLRSLWQKLIKGTKKAPYLLDRFEQTKNFGPLIRSAAFLTVRDYVICVDDLERHSNSLSIRDIFGLLTMLREERSCRVVVILNSDALHGADEEEYQRLREKVFDYEITFDPTPDECARIAFPDASVQHRLARNHAAALGIGNIRVLLRIERVIGRLVSATNDLDDDLLGQIVHSSVLIGWSYNTRTANVPSFEYLKQLNYGSFIDLPPTHVQSEEEKQWNDTLESYNYTNTDEIDAQICECYERGYLVEDAWQVAISSRAERLARARLEQRLHNAWELFRQGFGDDTEALARAFAEVVRDGAESISMVNASAVVGLVRDLGKEELADSLMNHWISVRARAHPESLSLEHEPFADEIKDQIFIDAVKAASMSTVSSDPSLGEMLTTFAETNGWTSIELRVLSNATENEFFDAFHGLTGPDLRRTIRKVLQFGEFVNSSPDFRSIADRARAALIRIGRESRLNWHRVQSLGISIPNEGESGAG